MKTTMVLFMALLLGWFSALADVPAFVIVKDQATETYKLIYKAPEKNNIRISIFNEEESLIYKEEIKATQGFIRPLNFAALKKGSYRIEIYDGKKVYAKEIIHKDLEQILGFHASRCRDANDKFLVSVATREVTPLEFNIYDGKGRIVHYEKINKTKNFAKIYNLKKFKGPFLFEVVHTAVSMQIIRND